MFSRVRFSLLVSFCASLAFGQIGTSTITGRVTDASGAVVPQVAVTLVNTNTNFQFSTVTNSDGLFRIQSLQPGPYRISFEATGFKRLIRENIDLRVGDTLPIDVTLEVGSVTDSVEVAAHAQLLETETSATGSVMEGELLHKLPLYQRYINSTLALVPGMTTDGYAYGGCICGYHLAGQRSGHLGIFDDGVVGNDQFDGTLTSETEFWTGLMALAPSSPSRTPSPKLRSSPPRCRPNMAIQQAE